MSTNTQEAEEEVQSNEDTTTNFVTQWGKYMATKLAVCIKKREREHCSDPLPWWLGCIAGTCSDWFNFKIHVWHENKVHWSFCIARLSSTRPRMDRLSTWYDADNCCRWQLLEWSSRQKQRIEYYFGSWPSQYLHCGCCWKAKMQASELWEYNSDGSASTYNVGACHWSRDPRWNGIVPRVAAANCTWIWTPMYLALRFWCCRSRIGHYWSQGIDVEWICTIWWCQMPSKCANSDDDWLLLHYFWHMSL